MALSREVPVIDIAPFLAGDPAATPGIVRSTAQALETIGFLVVTGHGIAPATLTRALGSAREFFDLPDTEKLQYHDVPGTIMGYHPLGAERVAYSHGIETAPDLKATFTMSRPDIDAGDPYYTCEAGRGMFQPLVWPRRPEAFKAAMLEYFAACDRLSFSLMELFALGIGLPREFFRDKTHKASNFLRVLDYPALDKEPLPEQYRIGPHSDYGTLTLVCADGAGLQVLTRERGWEDVPYVEGGIQVNIGDMLERWTNDRWVSTKHRVCIPDDPAERSRRRQSIAFFQMANYDVVIEPLPVTVDATHPAKYPPVTAGDDFMEKTSRQLSRAGEDVVDVRAKAASRDPGA